MALTEGSIAVAGAADGALFPGWPGPWAGTQAIVFRLISAVGALGNGAATNLSQGPITLYLETVVYP